MKRRDFVQRAAWLSAGFFILPSTELLAQKKKRKLVILHTNDIHSHIEAFDKNDRRNALKGGLKHIASMVRKIKSENPHVLLLDCGDVFQGTPYFNAFGGKAEFELMSLMGYDAGTIGNHDLDNGIDGLVSMLPHAKFPLLNCNYDFSGTGLEGKTKPWMVREVNGIRIGLFGLGIRLEGLVDPKNYSGITYLDPLVKSNETALFLKKEQACELVICLSHLGFNYKGDSKPDDLKLAAGSKNIDIILGGHTHTFLKQAVRIKNKSRKTVVVSQAGWAALLLGRIDLEL